MEYDELALDTIGDRKTALFVIISDTDATFNFVAAIGTAQLFYDLHCDNVRFVKEAEQWFAFDGRRWEKDIGGYVTAELCKEFVTAFGEYVSHCCADDSEFVKYAAKLTSHYRRNGILSDARSIAPLMLADFDSHKTLLNLNNGTLDLDIQLNHINAHLTYCK